MSKLRSVLKSPNSKVLCPKLGGQAWNQIKISESEEERSMYFSLYLCHIAIYISDLERQLEKHRRKNESK